MQVAHKGAPSPKKVKNFNSVNLLFKFFFKNVTSVSRSLLHVISY